MCATYTVVSTKTPSSALVCVCAAVEVSTERSIIHLDMDCFFASVAALGEPAFAGKPLAVSHSNSAQGTGEISSANYEARKFGIRASMFIAEAKKRCPHLIVMPYQFDKYEEVSEQVGPPWPAPVLPSCNIVV